MNTISRNRYASDVINLFQKEILRDCEQMIPDTRRRLANVVADLDTFIVSVRDH